MKTAVSSVALSDIAERKIALVFALVDGPLPNTLKSGIRTRFTGLSGPHLYEITVAITEITEHPAQTEKKNLPQIIAELMFGGLEEGDVYFKGRSVVWTIKRINDSGTAIGVGDYEVQGLWHESPERFKEFLPKGIGWLKLFK